MVGGTRCSEVCYALLLSLQSPALFFAILVHSHISWIFSAARYCVSSLSSAQPAPLPLAAVPLVLPALVVPTLPTLPYPTAAALLILAPPLVVVVSAACVVPLVIPPLTLLLALTPLPTPRPLTLPPLPPLSTPAASITILACLSSSALRRSLSSASLRLISSLCRASLATTSLSASA